MSVMEHPFLSRLQEEYVDLIQQAHDNNWIICLPKEEDIHGVQLNQEFINAHVLKPSATIKGYLRFACNFHKTF
jgi:hypothetical protein